MTDGQELQVRPHESRREEAVRQDQGAARQVQTDGEEGAGEDGGAAQDAQGRAEDRGEALQELDEGAAPRRPRLENKWGQTPFISKSPSVAPAKAGVHGFPLARESR